MDRSSSIRGGLCERRRNAAASSASGEVSRKLLLEERAQHDGAVAFRVTGTEEQRHHATPSRFEQRLPGGRIREKLSAIASLELRPPSRVVSVPAAERIARGDVAQLGRQLQCIAPHAAWPQPLDQIPFAVDRISWLVDTLDSYRHLAHSSTGSSSSGRSRWRSGTRR